MSVGRIRTLILAPAAVAAGCLLIAPVLAQSGTTVGKVKEKTRQAQQEAAPKAAGATQAQPAEGQPAPQPPEQSPLQIIAGDPNHLSAVKALEQIRRDEESAAEGTHFTYDPGDRRDPFLSPQDILQAQMSGAICQGEGMECWLIQDVTVIGVLSRRTGNVALVLGPDGYGATLREGDRLYDGEVRRIDPMTGLVVFRQRVNDPARIKPFRDVEKGLNLNKEGRS